MQWLPVPLLIVYRTIFALYSIIYLIYDSATYSRPARSNSATAYFYLSSWAYVILVAAYVILVAYFIFSSITTTLHYYNFKRRQGQEPNQRADLEETPVQNANKLCHKVLWLLYNVAVTMALSVTILYWILEYNGENIIYANINFHVLNSVLVILEHSLSSMPWRLLHVVYPMMFSILYTVANVMYWIWIDKKPIYRLVNYSKDPGLGVGMELLGIFVVVPVVHMFFYVVYRLRCFIEDK